MIQLIAVTLITLTLSSAFSLVRPAKDCRRCSGWGSKPSRRPRAQRRRCRRCDGTGKRFRVPARIAYRIRGAMRRHGELGVRAAKRAAEAEPGRPRDERERVTP